MIVQTIFWAVILLSAAIFCLYKIITNWNKPSAALYALGLLVSATIALYVDFFWLLTGFIAVFVIPFSVTVLVRCLMRKIFAYKLAAHKIVLLSAMGLLGIITAAARRYVAVTAINRLFLSILIYPTIIFSAIAVLYLLLSHFKPRLHKLFIYSFFIVSTCFWIIPMIFTVRINGWLIPIVNEGGARVTDDGLFEYRINSINCNQRNASAEIIVRDVQSANEIVIPLDINLFTRDWHLDRNWRFQIREHPRVAASATERAGVYQIILLVDYFESVIFGRGDDEHGRWYIDVDFTQEFNLYTISNLRGHIEFRDVPPELW